MMRQERVGLALDIATAGEMLFLHYLAACGPPVGKMSGRDLALTDGTLDKLEVTPGTVPGGPSHRVSVVG